MSIKDLKDFMVINGKLCFEVVVKHWLEFCPSSREKRNYDEYTIFHVERTIQVFIGIFIGRNIIGLRRLNMLLSYK